MMAWAQGGVGMSHGSQSQYLSFPQVPISQLQPGDLVFFGSSGPINHHVGLYIGGGTMIEAPHTGAFVRYASDLPPRPRTAGLAPVRLSARSLPCGRDPTADRPAHRVLARRGLRVQALARRSAHGARSRARLRTGRPIPNLLVGFDTADDAAVYRLRDDLAIVVTTDFFTPIVDDPFDWGRIAATNALSDVYAMGGTPLLALNLVAWPREALPFELLARVLDGGAAVAQRRGLPDRGRALDRRRRAEVRARRSWAPSTPTTCSRTRARDPATCSCSTKPIGLGVISTAVKRDGRDARHSSPTAVEVMTTLNASARDAAVEVGVHAATDVTGFGLLGHLREMCAASGVGAVLDAGAVPVIDGVRDLLAAGMVAGGTQRNHAFVAPDVDFGGLPEARAAPARRRADLGRAAAGGRRRTCRKPLGRVPGTRHAGSRPRSG